MIRIAIIATLIASPALAQTRQFYGADGSFVGQSMPSGPNARVIYDGSGNYAGTAMRAGNSAMIYDGEGNYAGMATNSGAIFGNE
jgi:hypothetical protein